ncbi:hypothetical protein EGW74_07425 [Enterococcus casseliflavus]|uniref:DUF7006 family protein n=1 Tax=Enterococcus casseliflavus TaxID=37734 RepID=UPI000F4EA379|nr:hypothetical protein [Enterococcus casseliflavus]ROY44012.1 hypothetical protein EGW74_07425 [Enterococcus casseliflavus]
MRISSKEEYLAGFDSIFTELEKRKEQKQLEAYLHQQLRRFKQLLEEISEEQFWQVFPALLGIDAKLSLVAELIPYEEFSAEEIIRITESDYATYFKELCGYDLSMETKHSIIFNVS